MKSDLLCFIQNKIKAIAVDQLVLVCINFYKEIKIMEARNLLGQSVESRLPKRKGDDICKSTVRDIIKVMLNPNQHLPIFYFVDMSRIPLIDMKHCDVSANLVELQSLQSEVRSMTKIQEELHSVRKN